MRKIPQQIGAFSMIGAALVVSSCASNDDVARTQHTADQAMATAEQAPRLASDAQQKAREANQKADAALSNMKVLEQRVTPLPRPKSRHRAERG